MKWLPPPVAPGSTPATGPGPGPGDRSEGAERALPGVHHGPARRTGSTPRASGAGPPGDPRKAGPLAEQSRASGAGPGKTSRTRLRRPVDEDRREQGRRREVGVRRQVAGRRERCSGPTAQTLPASSAGAERSRHFCPFLSRSRSRAVRQGSSAPRADETASGLAAAGRCKAGQPFSCRLSLLFPRPSSRPQRRAVSARRPRKGRSGLLALWFPGLASGRGSEDEKNQNVLGMS